MTLPNYAMNKGDIYSQLMNDLALFEWLRWRGSRINDHQCIRPSEIFWRCNGGIKSSNRGRLSSLWLELGRNPSIYFCWSSIHECLNRLGRCDDRQNNASSRVLSRSQYYINQVKINIIYFSFLFNKNKYCSEIHWDRKTFFKHVYSHW